jgi:hypothetical protein
MATVEWARFFRFYKDWRDVHGLWPLKKMRVILYLSLLTTLVCAGCTNKYGDDPSVHGLPTPAATPVPIATPIPEKAG